MKLKLLYVATMLAWLPAAQAELVEEVIVAEDFLGDFYGGEEMIEIATGIKTQIHKAPAVASVFNAEQIKQMGATDIDDVLEAIPGLHVSRDSNAYLPVYSFRGIRSRYNSQVLMLINGVPITNNFSGNRNQIWGGMPVEAISRIEVMRGPGSAIYGADAFAGVINIITKNADDIQNNQVGFRAGSHNTKDAWLALAGSNGELKYSAVLEHHKTDGLERDEKYPTQPFSLMTTNTDFRGEVSYTDWIFRLGYQLRNDNGNGAGIVEVPDLASRQKSQRLNFDLNYTKNISDSLELNAQLAYFQTSQTVKNQYVLFPAGVTLPNNLVTGDMSGGGVHFPNGFIGNPEVWERHKRLNITATYTGISSHAVRVGVGYHNGDLYRVRESKNFEIQQDGTLLAYPEVIDVSDTELVFLKETDRDNYYIYLQDVWSFANDWELTAGIRYDDYSDFGSTTNPRLALVWATSLNLTTKLLYGKAFRAPSFVDRGNINNPSTIGNPNIQPETIETSELVFDYHSLNGFGMVTNFYHYSWQDIIQFAPTAGVTGLVAQNLGEQSAYGTEFEFNWAPSHDLKVSVNYAWSKAENKTNNTDVALVPEQQWFAQVDWQMLDALNVNFKSHLVQNRLRESGDNREQIDDYWLSDLTLRWMPKSSNFEARLIVKNVFDADVREPSLINGASASLINDLPQLGRSFLGEVRYQF